jgi:hypothetical protein
MKEKKSFYLYISHGQSVNYVHENERKRQNKFLYNSLSFKRRKTNTSDNLEIKMFRSLLINFFC